MIEIRYRNDNHRITAWCRDPDQFGHLSPRPGQTITVIDADLPAGKTDFYVLDPDADAIDLNPAYKPPAPKATYWARIAAFSPSADQPLRIRRTYRGHTYDAWAYVTQDIVDAYQAGNLSIGDYVLVLFVDHDPNKLIATQKVSNSWD